MVKPDTYSMPRNAVDHIAFDYHVNTADRDAQRKCSPLRNLGLSAEVKAAGAYVFGTGYTRRIGASKMNVYNQPRAIELPPLVW